MDFQSAPAVPQVNRHNRFTFDKSGRICYKKLSKSSVNTIDVGNCMEAICIILGVTGILMIALSFIPWGDET